MATLTTRHDVETGWAESLYSTKRKLWTLAGWWVLGNTWWVLGTALFASGFLGLPTWARTSLSTSGLILVPLAALLLVLGGRTQYVVLRRSSRPGGTETGPTLKAWAINSTLAVVITLVVLMVMNVVMVLALWGIVGESFRAEYGATYLLAVLIPAGLAGALVGSLVGRIQWVVIHRHLAECGWVRMSTLGWMLGCAAGFFLMYLPPVISGVGPREAYVSSPLIEGVCVVSGLLVYTLLPGLLTAFALARGVKASGHSLEPTTS